MSLEMVKLSSISQTDAKILSYRLNLLITTPAVVCSFVFTVQDVIVV